MLLLNNPNKSSKKMRKKIPAVYDKSGVFSSKASS